MRVLRKEESKESFEGTFLIELTCRGEDTFGNNVLSAASHMWPAAARARAGRRAGALTSTSISRGTQVDVDDVGGNNFSPSAGCEKG